MLEQPGDHARSELNDQGYLVGGMTTVAERLLLVSASTAMCMVAATRSSMLHNDTGLHWVQLFSFFFQSLIV